MKKMKKYLVIVLALAFACTEASAQMKTAYFMEGSYFRTDMNPALAPTRGYIALPALGGIGLSVNNNFLSVDNFLYNRGGQTVTALHRSVSANDFLKRLPNTGLVGGDLSVNVLGVGFHTKKMFWNFGINAKVRTETAMSKDLFSMLKSIENRDFALDNTGASIDAYTEVYIGFALPIKEFATFGARVKGLVGVGNIRASFDNMGINMGENGVLANMRGTLRGSSMFFRNNYAPAADSRVGDFLESDFMSCLSNIKSGGVAVDLGAEVRLFNDRLRVSAAVTDLGFIKWSGATAVAGEVKGNFKYDGVDLENTTDVSEAMDYDLSFRMTEPDRKGYVSRLACDMNIGVEYNILKNHIAFGLLSHTRFAMTTTYTELTASVNFRLGRSFTTSVSHTFLNRNRPGVFGFALNAHPTGFNLFLGMDYIPTKYAKVDVDMLPFAVPVPTTLKSFNFYFGMGFNLGKAKYMASMQGGKEKPAKAKKSKKNNCADCPF